MLPSSLKALNFITSYQFEKRRGLLVKFPTDISIFGCFCSIFVFWMSKTGELLLGGRFETYVNIAFPKNKIDNFQVRSVPISYGILDEQHRNT